MKIEKAELYTYPDVVAFCGKGEFDRSSRSAMLLNPQVIFEVLSPSTEDFDRGDKFRRYQTFPSLTDYVLVASDRMAVEHFARQPDGSWPGTAFTARGRTGAGGGKAAGDAITGAIPP